MKAARGENDYQDIDLRKQVLEGEGLPVSDES
jgi:hypothetical protein